MFVFRYQGELAAGGDLHGINCVLDAGGLPGVFAGGGEGDFLQGLAGSHGSPGSGEPVPLHLLIILELVDDGWAALDEEGCQRHQAENAHRSSRHSQDCQHDQYSPQELDPLDFLEQLVVLGDRSVLASAEVTL